MNKNIIIAILIVIIIAVGAAFVLGQFNGKTGTQINFVNDDTLQDGEQVIIELKDSNGKPIAGEIVNITYNNNEKYSVVTDSNGKGYFIITGESSGKYDLVAEYAGNDKYDACTAKVTITITDGTADNPVTINVSSATASTDQYNNNTNNNNNTDPHAGCRFEGQFGVWVRNSDNIIVDARDDVMKQYIGMNFNTWFYNYGPGAPDPIPENNTNATT